MPAELHQHASSHLARRSGVDFKLKHIVLNKKRLKLTVWDTGVSGHAVLNASRGTLMLRHSPLRTTLALHSSWAGAFPDADELVLQRRTRRYLWCAEAAELLSRAKCLRVDGAFGTRAVYDITRRETFDNLSEVWLREVEMYSTLPDCVKMVVANKVDREAERVVTRSEGVAFARAHGCLFLEVSAKSRQGVQEAFAELVQRVRRAPAAALKTRSAATTLTAVLYSLVLRRSSSRRGFSQRRGSGACASMPVEVAAPPPYAHARAMTHRNARPPV